VAINEIGDGGIESFAVRTLHEKNGAIFQGRPLLCADILLNFGGDAGERMKRSCSARVAKPNAARTAH
jgi:hypothetical protein